MGKVTAPKRTQPASPQRPPKAAPQKARLSPAAAARIRAKADRILGE